MLPAAYRDLLRTPGLGRALATSLLARSAGPTAGLAVILLVVARTGSYRSAGAVSAVWVAGTGLGGLVTSRLLDRGRPARPVLLATAMLSAAGLVALALANTGSTLTLAALTAAAAVTAPPVVPTTRALWPVLLPDPDARATMYSLEATVQELTFIVGPSAAGAAAALASPSAAVVLAGAVGLAGVVGFVATPGLDRLSGSGPRARVGRADLTPLVPVYAASGLLICGLSFVEVGLVGAAGDAGHSAAAGPLLAVWSAGSLVGGLIGGARPPRRGIAGRLLVLLPAVAVGNLVVAATTGGLLLTGAVLVVSGALVAPALGGVYTLVEQRAPAGAVAQTFAGLTVCLLGGAALGSALAGSVVQVSGPRTAFLLGAVPPALAALVVGFAVARRPGRRDVAGPDPEAAPCPPAGECPVDRAA